jgi:hypothetical protein
MRTDVSLPCSREQIEKMPVTLDEWLVRKTLVNAGEYCCSWHLLLRKPSLPQGTNPWSEYLEDHRHALAHCAWGKRSTSSHRRN